VKTGDFPLPRSKHQVWALLHEESPRNAPFVSNVEFLRHFHFTSTFSRFSNFPLTTQYLPSGQALTSKDYYVPFAGKSKYAYRPSPSVVFLQSDCDTMSGREDYVKELMKHLSIDSYGSCLRNKDLPERQVGYSFCDPFKTDYISLTDNNHKGNITYKQQLNTEIPRHRQTWLRQDQPSSPRSAARSAGCSCSDRCRATIAVRRWATFRQPIALVNRTLVYWRMAP